MKKNIRIFIVFVLCVCMLFPMTAQAADSATGVPYDWGEEYSGSGGKVYSFTLKEKSNVYFELKVHGTLSDTTCFYNKDKIKVFTLKDFTVSADESTGFKTYTLTRVFSPSTYQFQISLFSYYEYTLFGTAEKAISLSRPAITSLKNSAAGKMTVKVSAVKNRTGYEFQYATNAKFTNAKTVKGGTTATIGNLKKGKTYYVRARAYTIYGAGNIVRSAWSPVQYVQIKK